MDDFTVRAALLAELLHSEGFGLDLIERVEKRTKGKVRLHRASIYPELRDMERGGLLSSYESEPLPERGGRPRRYYKLAAEGR